MIILHFMISGKVKPHLMNQGSTKTDLSLLLFHLGLVILVLVVILHILCNLLVQQVLVFHM